MQRELTRKEFLKVAGAGAAAGTLLGASALASGCQPNREEPRTTNNVVVVILDSLRKDHVGAYGNSWIKTPNMDALSRE
ncbi:MAG: sulfatase, partial [Actinobacteria bacterium]|nr:sulfatase [Actinomycetota bacterium]